MSLTNGDLSLGISRGIVSSVFSIVAGAALMVWQFLTRRTPISVLLLVIAIGLSFGIQNFWPINFLRSPAKPAVSGAFVNGKGVELAIDPASIKSQEIQSFRGRTREGPRRNISVHLEVLGLSPGYSASIQGVEANWTLSNGEVLKDRVQFDQERMQQRAHWSAKVIADTLGGPQVVNQAASSEQTSIFDLSVEKYQQDKTLSGKFSGTVMMQINRYVTVGEVALRVGERLNQDSTHINIVSVLKQTGGVRLILRERTVNLWFSGPHGEIASYLENLVGMGSRATYLLVNRTRGEAFLPEEMTDVGFSALLGAFSPLVNHTLPVEFASHDSQPVIDDAWLAGATLVRMQKIDAGGDSQMIDADDLPLSVGKE